jgi:hypothetical protein
LRAQKVSKQLLSSSKVFKKTKIKPKKYIYQSIISFIITVPK